MYYQNIIRPSIIFKSLSSFVESSAPSTSVKPLAVCDFNKGGACGWFNEEGDLKQRWLVDSGSLCLKAKPSSATAQNSDVSSWLPGLSIETVADENDVKARFKSPSVPSSFGLKCIGFDYSIALGKSEKISRISESSAYLALLQQQKGYRHFSEFYSPVIQMSILLMFINLALFMKMTVLFIKGLHP